MAETVGQRAMRWDEESHKPGTAVSFDLLHQQLRFRDARQFHEFVPTAGSEWPDFEDRFEMWLDNLPSDDDQRLCFQLASELVFYTREDFIALHRAALRGPISSWVVEQTGLMLDAPDTPEQLSEQLQDHTWYCGVSDSMQIADFHHANGIGGIQLRPDFRTLAHLGDLQRILAFMNSNPKPLRRIVLLEDFIGSGTQLMDARPLIEDLAAAGIPMLLAPLLICPDGDRLARQLAVRCTPHLAYRPLVALDRSGFLLPVPTAGEAPHHAAVRALLSRTYPSVLGNNSAAPRPYTPFGFANTGGLIVMYSNAPANTLPAIQHSSNSWKPLFPRSARVR